MDQEQTLLFTINAPKQLMNLLYKKLKDKMMTHGFAQKETCTLDLKEDFSLQEMQKLWSIAKDIETVFNTGLKMDTH